MSSVKVKQRAVHTLLEDRLASRERGRNMVSEPDENMSMLPGVRSVGGRR